MSAYKQDRLIAQLRADVDAANARAAALLAALERIAAQMPEQEAEDGMWSPYEYDHWVTCNMARDVIKGVQS